MRRTNVRVRYAVVGLGYIAQNAVLPAFANAKKNSTLAALVSDDPDLKCGPAVHRSKHRDYAAAWKIQVIHLLARFEKDRFELQVVWFQKRPKGLEVLFW